MSLDTSKVLVGLADQSTTGAVLCGDVLKTIPADFTAANTAINSFTSGGYVSEDGINFSAEVSTTNVGEWNKNIVRKLVDEFTGTISGAFIQWDYDTLCMVFGEEHVTKTAATSSHGELLHVKVGGHLPDPKCWAFKMKDGDSRIIIIIPNGQQVAPVDITFAAGEAIQLPFEISALDDGTGEGIHIYTDDGVAV